MYLLTCVETLWSAKVTQAYGSDKPEASEPISCVVWYKQTHANTYHYSTQIVNYEQYYCIYSLVWKHFDQQTLHRRMGLTNQRHLNQSTVSLDTCELATGTLVSLHKKKKINSTQIQLTHNTTVHIILDGTLNPSTGLIDATFYSLK